MSTSQWILENINPSIWKELGEAGLRPHVREFLDDKSLRKVLLWGRRTGSTFALSLRAALALASPPLEPIERGFTIFGTDGLPTVFADFFLDETERPRHILYIAPSRAQCEIFWEMTRKLAEAFGTLFIRKVKDFPFRLESPGARVLAFSMNGHPAGNNARGQHPDIFLIDGASYMDQEGLDNLVHPILRTRPETAVVMASVLHQDSKQNKVLKSCCKQFTVLRATIKDIPNMSPERILQTMVSYPADSKLIKAELFAEFLEE